MATRYATIDVGTNTVLLLVAEERGKKFEVVVERAEITRLGKGVDRTGHLDPEAIRGTVEAIGRFAAEARALGVKGIACIATSAARDAQNSADFFSATRAAADLTPEVISGDEEARLVYRSAWRDFGPGPLAVLDVGGGSTEFTWGEGNDPTSRRSLQIGAVRLTERHVTTDPISRSELQLLTSHAREGCAALQGMEPIGSSGKARLVGVAGTVTTICAVAQELAKYDPEKVHGATLALTEVEQVRDRLAALPVAQRSQVPGLEPKRADVIVAGCTVVSEAMRATGFDRLTVSDRGVRWGLLYDRFG
jgi:exopolyphosphatase/guanosine-5'-triphosphate,3'-diphosphate pyrophosphatase